MNRILSSIHFVRQLQIPNRNHIILSQRRNSANILNIALDGFWKSMGSSKNQQYRECKDNHGRNEDTLPPSINNKIAEMYYKVPQLR